MVDNPSSDSVTRENREKLSRYLDSIQNGVYTVLDDERNTGVSERLIASRDKTGSENRSAEKNRSPLNRIARSDSKLGGMPCAKTLKGREMGLKWPLLHCCDDFWRAKYL